MMFQLRETLNEGKIKDRPSCRCAGPAASLQGNGQGRRAGSG
ncbi:MAG: hypothetical protein JWL62_230 [Hyphomicrobiales bacterium]|nr:hypothetical protein [Hyphomicrobiales bacterium]